jgi:hypothetical protein
MRRRGPSLKGATPQKRGPKPKQATQDRYFEITKLVYRCLGAGYKKDLAVAEARKAYGLSRRAIYEDAVPAAEAAHKEELERLKAYYSWESSPPPDAPP